MQLQEPYYSWLLKNVGENLDAGTRFVVKVEAMTSQGMMPLSVDFDLTWFILLHSKDDEKVILDVALELLKDPGFLQQFQTTLSIQGAKRLIAEFLLFKPLILAGLKKYIDFTLLNVPIDFISHALFIKRNNAVADTPEIVQERIDLVNMVLDTGFSLTGDVPPKSIGVALHKVLTMPLGEQKFNLAVRLASVGFHLFSDNAANNNEIATLLINNRTHNDCMHLIKSNIDAFKGLIFKVAESNGNIADYYYWVKEDIRAVEFIKSTLNIDISS